MVNSVSSSNLIQTSMANLAFKSTRKNSTKKPEDTQTNYLDEDNKEIKENLNYSSKPISNSINGEHIDQIKKIASESGNNLSDQDINYAMRYGRSILVDRSA